MWLTNVNGTLFFQANDGTTGEELWAHVPAPAQIVQVLVPANGHYVTGNVLTFQVVFNQPVFVTGTPHLRIIIGSTVRFVPYVSGHGTHQLVFSYVIQPGDSDTDGIAFQPYPPAGAGRSVIFRPSGTSVRDADGIDLTLAGVSFLMPNLSGITIN
ncbi:MAG: hypothetical protein NZM42_11665 [Gemmatales bacterium]|nr:hypothetical protein [Gemmatales bacterium]